MEITAPSHIELPDGRILEYRVAGPEYGDVLVFHHGTPGAGLAFGPQVEAAAARGLRTVMYSRPGYGTSTRQPGRRVIDAAQDTARLMDALGVATFRTIGASGGGPHALACAAALPDRCLSTVTIAGVAPYVPDQLDWMAGMGPENVEEFGLTLQGADSLTPFLEALAQAFETARPSDVAAAFGGLLSDVDKAQVTDEFAEYLLESCQLALANGVAGQLDDDLAFMKDWGFDLGAARAVSIWQGAQDRMVPYAHGAWLADHIPGARCHLLPDQGHLSIGIGLFEQVLTDLLTM